MTAPRLVIFDVDGTIADSQGSILAAMGAAFDGIGHSVPTRDRVLEIVGLSLDVAVARLAPELEVAQQAQLVAGYKHAYASHRAAGGTEGMPLYPGMRALIEELSAQPATLLAVATGKSMRGLAALLDAHDLRGHFQSLQVADHHPSKPHPSMIHSALADTGVDAGRAVMIGDTSFDIDMANAAGVASIAVGWGFHPVAALGGASAHVRDAMELGAAIEQLIGAEGRA